MFMSAYQDGVKNHNKFFENVAEFNYLGAVIREKNSLFVSFMYFSVNSLF
jgi:hypothetical protein